MESFNPLNVKFFAPSFSSVTLVFIGVEDSLDESCCVWAMSCASTDESRDADELKLFLRWSILTSVLTRLPFIRSFSSSLLLAFCCHSDERWRLNWFDVNDKPRFVLPIVPLLFDIFQLPASVFASGKEMKANWWDFIGRCVEFNCDFNCLAEISCLYGWREAFADESCAETLSLTLFWNSNTKLCTQRVFARSFLREWLMDYYANYAFTCQKPDRTLAPNSLQKRELLDVMISVGNDTSGVL